MMWCEQRFVLVPVATIDLTVRRNGVWVREDACFAQQPKTIVYMWEMVGVLDLLGIQISVGTAKY